MRGTNTLTLFPQHNTQCGVLTDSGQVWTWGCEERGRLGQGDFRSGVGYVLEPSSVNVNDGLFVTTLAAGRSHMLCVTDHYEVFSWGDNSNLQLGHGGGGEMHDPSRQPKWYPFIVPSLIGANIVQVVCGESHSMALTVSGRVLTWGNGKHGRLGHGKEAEVGRPTVVDGLLGNRVLKISAGRDFNMVVAQNDCGEKIVWSWGKGDDGRLSSGASHDAHVPLVAEGIHNRI